ncbi:class I SAM-dependent methyltransferase [Solirubrobacter soli]|uniref:class I SAM-dependent methyltransferase n=1 Tax=Solirubrobacter soli TaxID=363832 RepID=UPI00069EB901|nr:class I SAM-dependent methyltransferase [Solirubrobacter soli]
MTHNELLAMLRSDDDHWWYRGRRRVVRAELEQLPIPCHARLLDAGCGSGRTLDVLADFGHASGIDLSEDAVDVARSRGHTDVHVAPVEAIPYADGTFDLVTCLDVIEHTRDDDVALRELRRVSRPGGLLLVTVPAYQALWSHHDEANMHYRRYERRSLRCAAEASGWTIVRETSFNGLLLAPAAAVRLATRRYGFARSDLALTPASLNRVLELPLRLESCVLGAGARIPVGLSLLAVLRRPAEGIE